MDYREIIPALQVLSNPTYQLESGQQVIGRAISNIGGALRAAGHKQIPDCTAQCLHENGFTIHYAYALAQGQPRGFLKEILILGPA